MFDFNDDEVRRYRNDALYHNAMQCAMGRGLSKDEAHRELVFALLDMKDEVMQQKINEAMKSSKPLLIGKE